MGISHTHHRGGAHQKANSKHIARNIILTVVLVLVALLIASAIAGYQLFKQAKEVQAEATQVVQSLTKVIDTKSITNINTLNDAINQAQEHASKAKTITDGGLWKVAQYIPVYGKDVTTVRGMTNILSDMCQNTLPEASEALSSLRQASLTDGQGGLNLQPLIALQPALQTVNSHVTQYQQRLQQLPQPHIAQLSQAYTRATTQMEAMAQQVHAIHFATQGLPALLGVNGARTYLLVAQTPSEQRSGSGLVGSMGTMSVDHGKITVGDFHPNGEFIRPQSPANAEEHAVFNGPLPFSMDVRDTFAVPDMDRVFTLLNFAWQQSPYASPVDGVIAIDPVFIQEMVKINGNVTLDNGQVLTGDNTAEFMLNTIYKQYTPKQQDQYFEYLANAVMKSAFSNMNMDKMMKTAKSLQSLARQRHFYAYTSHQDEAQYLQGAGFAKSAPNDPTHPEVGIYLNEQNPSKMGWYITRQGEVTKTADNTNGTTTYHVKYTLTNTLTTQEANTATDYILGGVQAGEGGKPVAPSGTSVQRMLFYAPAGGNISNFTYVGKVERHREAQMDGKSLLTDVAYLAPGKSVTYEFDVTTSAQAKQPLTIDQSPSGQLEVPVTYHE